MQRLRDVLGTPSSPAANGASSSTAPQVLLPGPYAPTSPPDRFLEPIRRPLSLALHLLRWTTDGTPWTDLTLKWGHRAAAASLTLALLGLGGLVKDIVTMISQMDQDVDLLLYSIFLDLLHLTAAMVGLLASVWKSLPTAALFLLGLTGDGIMLVAGLMFAAQTFRGRPVQVALAILQIALLSVCIYIAKVFHAALKMEERMRNTPNYNRRVVVTAETAREHARTLRPTDDPKAVPDDVILHLTEQLGVEPEDVHRALLAAQNDVEAATAMLALRPKGHVLASSFLL
jgi:NACalpha-BTF3-like transcription factor